MGKRKVYEESPTEPGESSRLWFHEDVYNVLTENQGTKKIKGIVVKLPKPDVIPLNAKSFLQMVNLEIFINRNARFSGRVDYLPNDLRWIEFGGQSNIHRRHTVVLNLSSNYHPRHLVRFDVSYSGIRQLNGFKNSTKLTSINLRGCKFLEKIPDLSGVPIIKYLNLHNCTSLAEVDDSVGFLHKLVDLNLSGCSKLTRFPTRLGLRSLERLYLDGCTRLESFPEIEKDKMEFLWYLNIQESGIRELPSSISYLTGLQRLEANGCENLTNIYTWGCPKLITTDLDILDDKCLTLTLPNLDYLDLEGCNLSESDFLVPLDCWSRLTSLDLSRNNFVSLPDCISKFVNLWELRLSGCKRLREIPQALPPELLELYLDDCTSLEKIPKLPPMLKRLGLTNCFRLRGDEVKILLNQESLRRSELQVILPNNGVPKWFSYTSKHPTTIEHEWDEEFVGGSEFYFEIPLHLQGETLLGLALSFVLDAATDPDDTYILINGRIVDLASELSDRTDMEATHVWLALVDLDGQEEEGDICQVTFQFPVSEGTKSCGVHLLSRNQDERFHLSLGLGTNE